MIDAALVLIGDRGYEGMSLGLVADATGVTKAAVYYHFRAKEDLLDAILQQLFADGPVLPDPRLMRSRRARLSWLAEQILTTLTHERRVLSVVVADPVIRKHPTYVTLVEETRRQALAAVYGEQPSVEDVATFYFATNAVHTLPDLDRLSDDELVAALRPALYRMLGIAVPAKAR